MKRFRMNGVISFSLLTILFILSGCGGGGGGGEASSVASNSTAGIVNDTTAPVFTSEANLTMSENHAMVIKVEAEDNNTVTYRLLSGKDSSAFIMNYMNGWLRFKAAPDFEHPEDENGDNIYTVDVEARDEAGNSAVLSMHIQVTDLDETGTGDSDNDYIPDAIEVLLGMDSGLDDEDGDGIQDGLATEGKFGDMFFAKQWHLNNTGDVTNASGVATEAGNDIAVLDLYHIYMGYNHGNPVIVQVVDGGLDIWHEDLRDNIDLTRSYDRSVVGIPSGRDPHGTMVAGIMAARALNGKGVRGIAPFAKISGSNWLAHQSLESLEVAWLSGDGADAIAVSNNSWGSYYDTDTDYETIMEQGTDTLRGGKGRVYVFAAGNDREDDGNANLQYVLNNRFAIAVAALTDKNVFAPYSSPGANIWVSAYGGAEEVQDGPTIATTTISGKSLKNGQPDTVKTWTGDTKGDYTFAMNGTSAASPMVSASIALVLEACPSLTWRDVKYLLATTATQVDMGNSGWVVNGAGLHFSIDYGFGLVNTAGMIDRCTNGYVPLPSQKSVTVERTLPDVLIPDDTTVQRFDLNVSDAMTLEWVELTVTNDSSYASDYRVALVSPNGTRITMMTEDTDIYQIDTNGWMRNGFRFGTGAMLDEEASGTWHIEISDMMNGDEGHLSQLQLKLYGH